MRCCADIGRRHGIDNMVTLMVEGSSSLSFDRGQRVASFVAVVALPGQSGLTILPVRPDC